MYSPRLTEGFKAWIILLMRNALHDSAWRVFFFIAAGWGLGRLPCEIPWYDPNLVRILETSCLPCAPYEGGLAPLFASSLRLIPIGDLSFRWILCPFLCFVILLLWCFFSSARSVLGWIFVLFFLVFLRAGAFLSPMGIHETPLLVLLLVGLTSCLLRCPGLKDVREIHFLWAGLLFVLCSPGPLLALGALASLCLCPPRNPLLFPRRLALFSLGIAPLFIIAIRGGLSLPGLLPIHGRWEGFLFSLLAGSRGPLGMAGLGCQIQDVASAMTWPVLILGVFGWFCVRPVWVGAILILLWGCAGASSMAWPVFIGVGLFSAGAILGLMWAISCGQGPGRSRHRNAGVLFFLLALLGFWIHPFTPPVRWSGRDRVGRILYGPLRGDSILMLGSSRAVADAAFELYIRRDGLARPGSGPQLVDRSSLGNGPGLWSFLKWTDPRIRLTQEELSGILRDIETRTDEIRTALLRYYLQKIDSVSRTTDLDKTVFWELESPNEPFLAQWIPIHIWARWVPRETEPLLPSQLDRVASLSSCPDMNRFMALGLSRYAALQLERAEAGLRHQDPASFLLTASILDPAELAEIHYHSYQLQEALGQREEAQRQLMTAIEKDPRETVFLAEMAWFLEKRGEYRDALSFHRRLISLAGRDPSIMMNYALCLASAGQHGKGIRILERLLRTTQVSDPIRIDLLRNLGVWLLLVNRPDEGLHHLEDALRLAPGDWDVLKAYAEALDMARMPREAIAAHEALLKMRPKDPDVLVNLGVSHANLMEYAEAQQSWEQALLLDPSLSEALLNLRWLHATLMYFDPERSILTHELLKTVMEEPSVEGFSGPDVHIQ